jgi:methylglutaconyl-CoA hydratase
MTSHLSINREQVGVARVIMQRPEIHNAFDDALIADLEAAFAAITQDDSVRVVVLQAEGKSFSAGADLNWMRRMAGYSRAENVQDAGGLARMLAAIENCPKPVIARVQGAAFGGGVGLVACCDIVVAAERAKFCLSEVKLGLIPAVISPYVVAAIGQRACRRYFLTAESFDAHTAQALGLVSEVTTDTGLDDAVDALVATLLANGPMAMGRAKDLIRAVSQRPISQDLINETAERIADTRASIEGREGLAAFLEKRPPAWKPTPQNPIATA